jgi:hypothetical protein
MLGTSPEDTKSAAAVTTIGIVEVACSAARAPGILWVTMVSTFERGHREGGKAIVICLGELISDSNILSFLVPSRRKPLSRASISRAYPAYEVTPR